jgi:hypothetical protein
MKLELSTGREETTSWREKLPKIPSSIELRQKSGKLLAGVLPFVLSIGTSAAILNPTNVQALGPKAVTSEYVKDQSVQDKVQETLSDWVWASYRNGSLKIITGSGIVLLALGGAILYEKAKYEYVCERDQDGNIIIGSDGIPLINEERMFEVEEGELFAASGTARYLATKHYIDQARIERKARNEKLQNPPNS